MHELSSLLAATAPTTAGSKSSGGSGFSVLLLVAIAGAFYVFVLRPRQRASKQAASRKADLQVGSSAMSVGGIKGTVVGIDGDDVRVEVAPGTILTFTARAVNAAPAPAVPALDDVPPEPEVQPPVAGGPDPHAAPAVDFGDSSTRPVPPPGRTHGDGTEG